jgi:hypothetical protein
LTRSIVGVAPWEKHNVGVVPWEKHNVAPIEDGNLGFNVRTTSIVHYGNNSIIHVVRASIAHIILVVPATPRAEGGHWSNNRGLCHAS